MGRQSPAVEPAGSRHTCPVTFKQSQHLQWSPCWKQWEKTPGAAGWPYCSLMSGHRQSAFMSLILSSPCKSLVMKQGLLSHQAVKEIKAQRSYEIRPKPRSMAELSPKPGCPSFGPLHDTAFSRCGSGVTSCNCFPCFHQPSLCLFWSRSLYVIVSSPAHSPFGKLPLGSVGSPSVLLCPFAPPCGLSIRMLYLDRWSSRHYRTSKVTFRGEVLFGFAFLFFSQVGQSTQAFALGTSRPKAVVHCLSPCLWLIAEFIFLLQPRPQTSEAFLLNWGGMNRSDGARVRSQCYWVLF